MQREDGDDEKPQRGGWLPGKQTACPRSPFPSLTRHHRTVNKRHSIQLTTSLSGSPVDVNAEWGWENLLGCSQNLRSMNSAFSHKLVFVKNRSERSVWSPCFRVGCNWHCWECWAQQHHWIKIYLSLIHSFFQIIDRWLRLTLWNQYHWHVKISFLSFSIGDKTTVSIFTFLLLSLRLRYWIDGCIPSKGRRQWKKTFSFGHCPNYLNPPMTQIQATWSSFFGSRNSRFESQFRTKNTICTI